MTVFLAASKPAAVLHTVMPLTDTAVRQAKAEEKPRKLADERGLYLLVNTVGKYWRMD